MYRDLQFQFEVVAQLLATIPSLGERHSGAQGLRIEKLFPKKKEHTTQMCFQEQIVVQDWYQTKDRRGQADENP